MIRRDGDGRLRPAGKAYRFADQLVRLGRRLVCLLVGKLSITKEMPPIVPRVRGVVDGVVGVIATPPRGT